MLYKCFYGQNKRSITIRRYDSHVTFSWSYIIMLLEFMQPIKLYFSTVNWIVFLRIYNFIGTCRCCMDFNAVFTCYYNTYCVLYYYTKTFCTLCSYIILYFYDVLKLLERVYNIIRRDTILMKIQVNENISVTKLYYYRRIIFSWTRCKYFIKSFFFIHRSNTDSWIKIKKLETRREKNYLKVNKKKY